MVDQAMLDAASQGVTLAEKTVEQECGKVGENCRKRQDALAQAVKDRAPLMQLKATADQIDAAEKALKALDDEKAALPPAPDNIDAAAYRLSKLLGKVVELGSNPVEATADILIYSVGGFAEMIALLGPVILLTAMSSGERSPGRWWQWRRRPETRDRDHRCRTGNCGTCANSRNSRKGEKAQHVKGAGVREVGSVREWKESRTTARPGSKVKPGDAYGAYKAWCIETGKEPVSLTAFGTIMKGELGVQYEEKNKRGFYLDIALVSAPKLVAIDNAPAQRALGGMVSVRT